MERWAHSMNWRVRLTRLQVWSSQRSQRWSPLNQAGSVEKGSSHCSFCLGSPVQSFTCLHLSLFSFIYRLPAQVRQGNGVNSGEYKPRQRVCWPLSFFGHDGSYITASIWSLPVVFRRDAWPGLPWIKPLQCTNSCWRDWYLSQRFLGENLRDPSWILCWIWISTRYFRLQ